jgi:Ca2+-binding EF-hand superfamily protein
MFKLFDKDGDKSLSTEEISRALKSMGVCLTYKEIQVALKDIRKNSTYTFNLLGLYRIHFNAIVQEAISL